MAQATVFNPVTKERKVVTVGDPNAFQGGFMLETPTQNLKTYSATPVREIAAGPNGQLVARDNKAGTSTPIANPSQISSFIGQGFQDSRAPLFPAPSSPAPSPAAPGAYTPSGGAMGPISSPSPSPAPAQSSSNPVDSFNFAIANLLRQAQSGNTGDADLIKQRNDLIQARFNSGNNATPEALRVLSPGQQDSLRSQDRSGLETQLSGVNTAIQSRERQRETALNLAKEARQMLKDFQADERANRDDARALIKDQFTLFGGAAFGNASKEELARLEGQAGLPAGSLGEQKRTLKQQELEQKGNKTSYAPGIIGEYQFYSEQETAAGRTPKSFNDFQTLDANRKATAAGTNGLTPNQIQSTINQIANQFDNEQVVKEYNQVAAGYQFARQLGNKKTPSPSDDQGLIYAFAKAMDPGSVVREGEYATVQKYAQSFAQTFGFTVDRIFSNSPFLTAEARNNMIGTIKAKYDVSKQAYDNVANEYNRRIEAAKSGVVGGSITDYAGAYQDPVAAPRMTDEQRIAQEEQRRGVSLSPQARQQFLQGSQQTENDPMGIRFNSEAQTSLKGIGGSLAVKNPNPSKVIASSTGTYDFTNYATDPNWGNAVKSHMNKTPQFNSPEEITSFIRRQAPKSPITGDMVIASAQKFNVDPRLILAIAKQEANYATLGRAAYTFNPGNVGNIDSGSNINWGSWQKGMDALARNISRRSLNA